MAIYHFTATTGTRSGGQSARAKFDYMHRLGDYEKKGDRLLFSQSSNMPSWAKADARAYWQAADEHERANGRLFKHIEASLPVELTLEQNIALVRKFAAEVTGRENLPFSLTIHAGDGQKELPKDAPYPQPHFDLAISERINDGIDRGPDLWFKRAATGKKARPEDGGARKTDSLKPKEWLEQSRKLWADMVNDALAEAGHDVRIDHRSLVDQCLEAIAQGDLEKAEELNRLPKSRLPRQALEFEARTGEKSELREQQEQRQAEQMAQIRERRDIIKQLKEVKAEVKALAVQLGTELRRMFIERRPVRAIIDWLNGSERREAAPAQPLQPRPALTLAEQIAASKAKLAALNAQQPPPEPKPAPSPAPEPAKPAKAPAKPRPAQADPAAKRRSEEIRKKIAERKRAEALAKAGQHSAKPVQAAQDDPQAAARLRREREREELHKAIDRWLRGGGKATDSRDLLRRAVDGDDVSGVKKLLEGSAAYDRTCAVRVDDIEHAADKHCSDPMFKLLIKGEGSATDSDTLKRMAEQFKKGGNAASRLDGLIQQVKQNGGDLESVGLTDPKPEHKSPSAGQQAGPSMGGGGPKMGR